MRSFFLYLLLFMSAPAIHSQTNIQTINKALPSSPSNRWDIKKYLWGYTHNSTSYSNKFLVDFNTIDSWQRMSNYLAVSNNGRYFAYSTESGWGPRIIKKKLDSLIVQTTNSPRWRRAFAGIQPGFFAANNKQYVLQHKDSLYFLQLGSEKIKIINNVKSYKTTGGSNQWMAYQLKNDDNSVILLNLESGQTKQFQNIKLYSFDNSKKWLLCETNSTNKMIVCNLESGKEQSFPNVQSYTFSPGGAKLMVNTGNELQYINLIDQTTHTIYTLQNSSDKISDCQFDLAEKQVIFSVTDNLGRGPLNTIWHYKEGMAKAVTKINQQILGLAPDAVIKSATFTDNGRYIKFWQEHQPSLQPSAHDAVQLDVWSYKDHVMQAAQVNLLKQKKISCAVIGIEDEQVKWMGSEGEELQVLQGDYAIIKISRTQGERFWESRNGNNEDTNWLINLNDGKRRLLPVSGKNTFLWFSPGNHYLIYFDAQQACHYFSYDLITEKTVNISHNIPIDQLGFEGRYERTDKKPEQPCGLAGWLENDAGLLVYDNNDLWQLDLTGKKSAINLTHGYGRNHGIIFRLMNNKRYGNYNPDVLKANELILLSAFHTIDKTNGFYQTKVGSVGEPIFLSMGSHFMHIINNCQDPNLSNRGLAPIKAQGSNIWIVQRQAVSDAPNYFSTKDFKSYNRLTNSQPHRNYRWIAEELHTFPHLDGKNGQGILYKPENFDSSKKYPVLIVFYGGYSNNMHQFPVPSYHYDAITPGSSPIWFVNNGYLVFTPDIYVAPLKYGPEAFNVIEGAATYLKSLPYVDASGLGCASHSWSAKLGAYVFTHSNSFGAMTISEGFLYGNMINVALSTDENGKSKLETVENGFQFGNLWENREAWLEQTTVLNVHKASSPLLLFCNKVSINEYLDQTQQLFTALWRLEKKAWWLKYDKGGHNLYDQDEQKDYTIRYTQFFDHYLKKAPAPRWMTQGIPAALKGIEARYELDPSGSCGKDCKICQKWNEKFIKNPTMFELPISEWSLDK